MSSMKSKKLAALLVAPLLLLIVVAVAMTSGRKEASGEAGPVTSLGDWYRVEPISFDLTINATGELEARNKVEIKSRVAGRPAIIEIVPEGTTVAKGDLLFRLDSDDTEQRLEQARLDTERARADKVAAERTLEIELSEAESNQRAAEVKLALAQLDLARWAKGSAVQRRNELSLALEKAKRRVERAKRDLELSKELYEQQFISLNELEDAEIEQIEANDGLATAQLNIEVFEQYEFNKDQQKAQSDVEQAQAELERTISRGQSTIERLSSDLESKRLQLVIREQRLRELEDQLANTQVFAPQAGLVVYATSVGSNWRRGSDPIGEGRQVQFNETVVFLPDTREMVANVRVHEALIGQVNEGQSATVVIDAQRDQTVSGSVISKAVTPEDGGFWNPNLREYRVRIELPTEIDGLKPAMRCTATLFIGRVENAIAVPVQAVFTEGDQRYVHVPAGAGRVRRQPVSIGRASEALVEVTSGLETGDRVLLRDPRPGEIVEQQRSSAPTPAA